MVQWVWPTIIQKELYELHDQFNNHVVRKVNGKVSPPGVSPNIAYALPDQCGSENHLQPIDKLVAQGLMEAIGGQELIQFMKTGRTCSNLQQWVIKGSTDQLATDFVAFVFLEKLLNS
ncbi:hypothetical protein JB92DRAFT_2838135 [Gautieria morchelliformis]|nr:hypothetical protein JB92DRAFT_2838135 [Gautieria morchelliformis]